jgi:hypothetical protein
MILIPTRYIITDIKKVPEGVRRKVSMVQDQHNNARLRIQKQKKRLKGRYTFNKCFSLKSLSYSLYFMCVNNAKLQAFYRYKILDN